MTYAELFAAIEALGPADAFFSVCVATTHSTSGQVTQRWSVYHEGVSGEAETAEAALEALLTRRGNPRDRSALQSVDAHTLKKSDDEDTTP